MVATVLSEVPNHVPSTEVPDLFPLVAHFDEHVEDVPFLELSEVSISTSDALRVLHRWIELSPDLLAVLEAVVGDLQRHFQEREASVAVGGVANAPDHEHSIVLIDRAEVARQVPGRAQYLVFNEFRNLLLEVISLLRAILVRGVADLVSVRNVLDASHPQHGLPVESTLIPADHLWRDQVLDGLVTELLGAGADLVLVYLHRDLLDELFAHLVGEVGEQVLNLLEVYLILVFLQKSDDVSLRVLLDVGLVNSRLRVAHVLNGLDLPHGVNVLNFSQNDLLDILAVFVFLLVLEVGAEEVCVLRLVEEHRRSVELVAQDSDALEQILVDVSKERQLLVLSAQNLPAIRPHVGNFGVVRIRQELLGGHGPVAVQVSVQLRDHPKVVHENRVLIDVLENAEFAILERQLDSVLEVLVRVDGGPLPVFPLDGLSVYDRHRQGHMDVLRIDLAAALPLVCHREAPILRDIEMGGVVGKRSLLASLPLHIELVLLEFPLEVEVALNIRSMEASEIFVNVPLELRERKIQDALGVTRVLVETLLEGLVLYFKNVGEVVSG